MSRASNRHALALRQRLRRPFQSLAALCSVFALLGCPDMDEGADLSPPPRELRDLVGELCSRYAICMPDEFERAYTSLGDCTEALTDSLEHTHDLNNSICRSALEASLLCQIDLSCTELNAFDQAESTACDPQHSFTQDHCMGS